MSIIGKIITNASALAVYAFIIAGMVLAANNVNILDVI